MTRPIACPPTPTNRHATGLIEYFAHRRRELHLKPSILRSVQIPRRQQLCNGAPHQFIEPSRQYPTRRRVGVYKALGSIQYQNAVMDAFRHQTMRQWTKT
jgi:hypothetical protein